MLPLDLRASVVSAPIAKVAFQLPEECIAR